MKKIFIIVLASALLVLAAACAKPADLKPRVIGDWMYAGEGESPYGMFVAFTKTTAAYGISAEVEEGREPIDYLPMFKRIAKILEITYDVEDNYIILHEAHMNYFEDEETGETIPGEDARVPYSVKGDTLYFGGYAYTRITYDELGNPQY